MEQKEVQALLEGLEQAVLEQAVMFAQAAAAVRKELAAVHPEQAEAIEQSICLTIPPNVGWTEKPYTSHVRELLMRRISGASPEGMAIPTDAELMMGMIGFAKLTHKANGGSLMRLCVWLDARIEQAAGGESEIAARSPNTPEQDAEAEALYHALKGALRFPRDLRPNPDAQELLESMFESE